jgi:hypothetical protein
MAIIIFVTPISNASFISSPVPEDEACKGFN